MIEAIDLTKDEDDDSKDFIIIDEEESEKESISRPVAIATNCPVIPDFLLQVLKPHQLDGVKFMWKSITNISDDKVFHGCVLAHAQGLGKSLQMITLSYVLATHSIYCNKKFFCLPSHLKPRSLSRFKTLILCPTTLVENWALEYQKWIGQKYLFNYTKCFSILSNSSNRFETASEWYEKGGVLVVGYELFRYLSFNSNNRKWKEMLLKPGPNLLICDEAHKLKNRLSSIYEVVSKVSTPSKICLTGSPLQNNLEEYFSMMEIVYPEYLYDFHFFRYRFSKPIIAGLNLESNHRQVKVSRRKLYALQKLLDPLVFRISVPTLSAELDPFGRASKYEKFFSESKVEFVIMCKLTPIQLELYQLSLNNFKDSSSQFHGGIFYVAYQLMILINHPSITKKYFELKQSNLLPTSTIYDLNKAQAEIIDLTQDFDIPYPDVLFEIDSKKISSAQKSTEDLFYRFFQDHANIVWESECLSTKASAALFICKRAKDLDEKVLLFSRSLLTLDYLESMLLANGIGTLRFDGKINPQNRISLIDTFRRSQEKIVFLISTLAGSLGVNCQCASRVILFDVGWNPIHDEQAIARCYRYGQQKPVFVYRLYGCDSIEDTILKINIRKLTLFKLVIEQKQCYRPFSKRETADYFIDPQLKPTEVEQPEKDLLGKDVILKELFSQYSSEIVRILNYDEYINPFEQYFNEDEKREADFFLELEEEELRSLKRSKRLEKYRARFKPKIE